MHHYNTKIATCDSIPDSNERCFESGFAFSEKKVFEVVSKVNGVESGFSFTSTASGCFELARVADVVEGVELGDDFEDSTSFGGFNGVFNTGSVATAEVSLKN